MSVVYKYLAGVIFLAVLVQIGFAGYGAFSVAGDVGDGPVDEDRFEDVWGLHLGLGYLVILLGLILMIVALVARHRIKHSVALFALLIVQMLLAWIGYEVAWIGFFHPVNAVLIAGLTGMLAMTEWRGERATVVR